MPTLEERVERLETFMGDIDKITSVYANSIQEICDKYLSLLYIEEPDENHVNHLTVKGFLSKILDETDPQHIVNVVPRNVVFHIRASHDYAYDPAGGEGARSSMLHVERQETESHRVYAEFPLKKLVDGNTAWLSPGDFKAGTMYDIYINSQGEAIISVTDVQALAALIAEVQADLAALSTTATIATLDSTTATIDTVNATNLTLTNAITLPNGTIASTQPANDNSTKVATTAYVDRQVAAKIEDYHNKYHIFGTGNPDEELAEAEEKAIYFKF